MTTINIHFRLFFHYFRCDKIRVMRKWIIIPALLMFFSCKDKQPETYMTPDKATKYFKAIEEICNRDNGQLWGKKLNGPLMFVDRRSRLVIANEADNQGLLKGKDGYFTGFFPWEMIVNNAPAYFGGKLYAMDPLPEREDDYAILSQSIHSLFHLFQDKEGIPYAFPNTANMDEKEARMWIKLEWKALHKALVSQGEDRQLAIRDALIFRGSNREMYQKYVKDENRFETYEGLSTFTYTLLSTKSNDEFKFRLFQYLDRLYNMQSFSRSYGAIHGALYATLLYYKGFDFKQIRPDDFDLGKAVKDLYNIELPDICRDVAGSLALNYDIETVQNEENQRLVDIKQYVQRQISIFTEKPLVFIELQSPYFDFEPEDVHPMDTLGILYTSMRVSDNWGKLTVQDKGCLISNNYKSMKLSAKGFNQEKNRITGDGFTLTLNEGWEPLLVDQNYFVRKTMP
jgi:hypothetical protein